MLIFDQLKKNDPQLRLLAAIVFFGMAILLGGLWWVQIVSTQDYQAHLETQSFRTVRIPAVRGKILDRTGTNVLAENRPIYNVSLYLEELKKQFEDEYKDLKPKRVVTNSPPFWMLWFGATTIRTQQVRLSAAQIDALSWEARYHVASNTLMRISQTLQKPLPLDNADFKRHYQARLVLPYSVKKELDSTDISRFEEQCTALPGVDLEIQSARYYPYQTTAAHLIGQLGRDDSSIEGEEAFFSYRLPDYRGRLGIECALDAQLHGRAGAKSVLVNNFGFKQTENVWSPAEQGKNVVLTIDLQLQQAVEHALKERGPEGSKTRGAAVVMDVRTGDVLAIASSPTYDPNYFVQGFPPGEYQRISGLSAEKNRATQENYRPGSIFKTVVGLACLENGLDPKATYDVQPNPRNPTRGYIFVGRRGIKDTAPPGTYDFRRALIHSSNSYFITNGLRCGVDKIVQLGRRLHLGERMNLGTRQETAGTFPTERRMRSGWSDGDTANLCIGQGYIDVSPLQMTVMACALANGGKVLWPRLIDRIESPDPAPGESPTILPKGQIRDTLGVSPRSMKIVRDAMLDDVESSEGTGTRAFVPGLRICAKTGTAEIQDEENKDIDQTTWFLSFAPYESPRYAVVVMIESGGSGGATCAPIAHDIYLAIQQWERTGVARKNVIAQAN
jgi:penicillin-binding protein 2